MVDIEGNSAQTSPNPYTGPGPNMPENIYLYKAKCLLYMIISLFALQRFNFYQVILKSPHVSHEWFKIGLAGSIGKFARIGSALVQFKPSIIEENAANE